MSSFKLFLYAEVIEFVKMKCYKCKTSGCRMSSWLPLFSLTRPCGKNEAPDTAPPSTVQPVLSVHASHSFRPPNSLLGAFDFLMTHHHSSQECVRSTTTKVWCTPGCLWGAEPTGDDGESQWSGIINSANELRGDDIKGKSTGKVKSLLWSQL